MSQSSRPIKSLQIGMHWFPERAGGLDRMYYSLVGALPGAGVEVRARRRLPKSPTTPTVRSRASAPHRSRLHAGCSPRAARCARRSAASGLT